MRCCSNNGLALSASDLIAAALVNSVAEYGSPTLDAGVPTNILSPSEPRPSGAAVCCWVREYHSSERG